MVTVITKTIGSGKDYASFTLAEADVPNIVGSRDLVGQDTAVVFEADAGTYNESVSLDGTLATDATRNVTYRAAAGSEHGGDKTAGVVLTSSSSTLNVLDAYTNVRGIVVSTTSTYAFIIRGNGAVASDCIAVGAAPSATSYGFYCSGGGTASAPIRIENCVAYSGTAGALYAYSIAADINIVIVNTTGIVTGGSLDCFRFFEGGFQATATLTNCLAINLGSGGACQTHTATFSGTNNFGPATAPFPVALRGTPHPVTASTAYDPGAGDFALYVGKNGALLDSPNNDVIGVGVGPSVNSDVPTTDILGNERSGATANPGAFEVPQATAVLTRTIGSGKDYASFTLAEADVANIGASADLVFENETIVFEADAGTYNEPSQVHINSTLVTDAARHVTYTAAPGSDHGGILGAGVFIDQLTGPRGFYIEDANTHLIGLGVRAVFDACATKGPGTVAQNCIFESTTSHGIIGLENVGVLAENCVAFHQGNRYGFYLYINPGFTADGTYINCTAINRAPSGGYSFNMSSAGGTITAKIVNCLGISDYTYRVQDVLGPVTVTGSNNFGGSVSPFLGALQGTPYPITPSQSADPGAGDYALYVGKNGALLDSPNNDVIGQGVGPAANSDIPLFDILGNFRAGDTANPGAFEIPQATTVIKKTIGPVGRDYATFTAAEADVANIAVAAFGSADLVANNGAIVFEADAATYSESVTFQSTLTTDATRNVTYRAAAGSEHGGIADAGVFVNATGIGRAFDIRDANIRLIQLSGRSSTQQACFAFAAGAVFQNCILESTGNSAVSMANDAGLVAENCVVRYKSNGFYPYIVTGYAASLECINCTAISLPSALGYDWHIVGAGGSVTANLVNCLSLGANAYLEAASSGGTTTVTGSNNFSGSVSPWPVALRGTPYPITPTTDTDPGPGDWAIYDADTGALINDSDNDVLAGGVGPSANSDVPEMDIVGNLRSGSTADPGAFEISSIPAPLPGLSSDMQQTYQAEAAYTLALTPSGVTNVTHQQDGANDYLRVNNSTRSREVNFPDGVQAVRVVALADQKPCSVTVVLDDGAGGEVESDIGYVGGGVIQADFPYLWNLSALQSDGTYPKLKFTREGTWIGNQDIYVWWHTS